MTTPKTRSIRPGGRSARVRRAVLDATLEVLLEARSIDGLAIADVAERSGVHKTTIYRRWEDTQSLVLDMLLERSEEQVPIPDTGSLRGDLLAQVQSTASHLASDVGRALLIAAVSDGSPALQDLRRQFYDRRFALAGVIVERARDRGEIDEATSSHALIEALVAPLFFRVLVTGAPVEEDLEDLVDMLLDGVGIRPEGGR